MVVKIILGISILDEFYQPGCDALPLERSLRPDPGNPDDDVLPPIPDDVPKDTNVRLVQASQRNLVGPKNGGKFERRFLH